MLILRHGSEAASSRYLTLRIGETQSLFRSRFGFSLTIVDIAYAKKDRSKDAADYCAHAPGFLTLQLQICNVRSSLVADEMWLRPAPGMVIKGFITTSGLFCRSTATMFLFEVLRLWALHQKDLGMPLFHSHRIISLQLISSLRGLRITSLIAATALTVSACATYQDPVERTDGYNDPYEAQNRAIHGFNKGLDKNLVRPVAKGYAAVIPPEIRDRVNDFSENLQMPGVAINSLLQADLRGAGLATTRFLMNSTVGLAGFFDPASDLNVPEHDTDFGETLAVWGVGEGAYIEMPVFGPSTQRDAIGFVTDIFTNPLTFFTIDSSPEQFIPPTAYAGAALNDRERFGDTFDSVLYESADSYAQSRSIYLQNRRFELGEGGASEEDAYLDPYDPYLDPYAE